MSDKTIHSDSASSFGADSVGYDPTTGTFHARFDADSDASRAGRITTTVVTAVATATNTDPVVLTPLFESVDPEALAALVASTREQPVDVSFSYEDCRVTVSSSGSVVVEAPES